MTLSVMGINYPVKVKAVKAYYYVNNEVVPDVITIWRYSKAKEN